MTSKELGMFIAGDVGGTKTILALVSVHDGPHAPLCEKEYRSNAYASLVDILVDFSGEIQHKPQAASIGIAGPVHNNQVDVTNLPWDVQAHQLSEVLHGAPVSLLNDLESIAYAVPNLESGDTIVLKEGKTDPRGAIAIVAPGTGLGEAYLVWDGKRYRPVPSEGGHTDFAPATPLELELLSYLMPRLGHVSYERVCSGVGIPNIYDFLKETGGYKEPEGITSEISAAVDKTPIIVKYALDKSSEVCVRTLSLFISILGSEAGNLVLQAMATGGVYLAGGIPMRIIEELKGEVFYNAFTRKGRLSEVLLRVPVSVIMNRKAALYGAASHSLLAYS
ncbi:MAG: glucokinase [Candidatus Promineifilaceae bacterium]